MKDNLSDGVVMGEELDVPVLVVGAGVAGLAAAITIARYGVASLVVERRPESSGLPRATAISTRSMELVRSWGLHDEVLAGGVDAEVWLWEAETLAQVADGQPHAAGFPTRDQAALISPTAPAVVPQDWLEQVLRKQLGSLPAARLDLGTELVGLSRRADGVRAEVRDRTGEVRAIRASYLVAADGAHSLVRQVLGIRMSPPSETFSGMQVVFRAPLWPLVGDLRYVLYSVTTPQAPGSFLPAGRDDRWVYGISGASTDPPAGLTEPHIVDLIRRGAGVADLPVQIERIGPFTSVGQLADRFRTGRVFLTGDAAHRVTPRGGTGMNAALHSGHDLGWKLAWVLRGWADSDLLDSYEAERRPVAEHNVVRSADPNGSRRQVVDELHVDLGGRLTHAWLPYTPHPVSTLDLLGPGWTLLTGPFGAAWTAAAANVSSCAPLTAQQLDPMTARAVGLRGDGALLVRPDGVPVGIWPTSVRAALEFATAISRPGCAKAERAA